MPACHGDTLPPPPRDLVVGETCGPQPGVMLPPQGTAGNIWTHFGLSRLSREVVGSSMGIWWVDAGTLLETP